MNIELEKIIQELKRNKKHIDKIRSHYVKLLGQTNNSDLYNHLDFFTEFLFVQQCSYSKLFSLLKIKENEDE